MMIDDAIYFIIFLSLLKKNEFFSYLFYFASGDDCIDGVSREGERR